MNKTQILFLGYDNTQTRLIDFLIEEGYEVYNTSEKVNSNFISKFDWIVSFGYRHIIPKHQLEAINYKAINLHMSYLPYNRGSHPNYWSFIDNTPKGVTIHQINEGLDTGDIYVQEELDINPQNSTFVSSYNYLLEKLENLFIFNHKDIFEGKINPSPQVGKGTYHKIKDLPLIQNWNININRYLNMSKRTDKDIIDEIENIRTRNNVNWMDAVRLAFELDPERARAIFKDIKECDFKINELLEELSENE